MKKKPKTQELYEKLSQLKSINLNSLSSFLIIFSQEIHNIWAKLLVFTKASQTLEECVPSYIILIINKYLY